MKNTRVKISNQTTAIIDYLHGQKDKSNNLTRPFVKMMFKR